MPFYNFSCKKCQKEFEEICTFSDYDNDFPEIRCPECNSKSLNKNIPSGSGIMISKDTYDYRLGVNMEKAKAERAYAESKYKGKSPYRKFRDE